LEKLKQMYFKSAVFERAKEIYLQKNEQIKKEIFNVQSNKDQNVQSKLISTEVSLFKELARAEVKEHKPRKFRKGKKDKRNYIED
jgi:hypothetical protein